MKSVKIEKDPRKSFQFDVITRTGIEMSITVKAHYEHDAILEVIALGVTIINVNAI